MALQLDATTRTSQIQQVATALNNGSIKLFSGSVPANTAASDPATILSAPFSRLVSNELGLDEIVRDLAREHMERGIELATQAGFQAEGRLDEGKPWRMICQSADTLGAEPIVVGARGLGRVESALLGSVSTAVVFHTKRPVLVVPQNEDDRPPETPTE